MKAAFEKAAGTYIEETHPKLRMLDNFILLSLATFVIQVVYGILFNRDPFNSFIAGVFCSLGTFGLSASLRIQLKVQEPSLPFSKGAPMAQLMMTSMLQGDFFTQSG